MSVVMSRLLLLVHRPHGSWLPFLLVALVTHRASASVDDDLRERGIVAIEQHLLDLTTLGRVLNFAAHPDDEDGATLAWCRHHLGLRAMTAFANRGEGGQNEIGSELYRELGAIRETETRRAAAWLGSHPYFLGLDDFGYCKTADEAFGKWGGMELVVERAVFAIRSLRPDVIFTNHDPTHGHGQHRALSIAAREAFLRAGDPDAFPEQGLPPWEATLYLERTSATEPKDEYDEPIDPATLVIVPVDDVDPIRGTTYHEQARRALKEHRSQGRWDGIGRGKRAFRTVHRRHEEQLERSTYPFDPAALTRLRWLRARDAGDLSVEEEVHFLEPELFAPTFPSSRETDALFAALVKQRGEIAGSLPRRDLAGELRESLREDLNEYLSLLNETIALILGVDAELTVTPDPAVEGTETSLTLRIFEGAQTVGNHHEEHEHEEHNHGEQGHDAATNDAPKEPLAEGELRVPQSPITFAAGYSVPLATSPLYDLFDPARRNYVRAAYTLRHLRTGRSVSVAAERAIDVRPAVSVDISPRRRVVLHRDQGTSGKVEVNALARVDLALPLVEPVELGLVPANAADDASFVWRHLLPAGTSGVQLLPIQLQLDDLIGERTFRMVAAGNPTITPTSAFDVTLLDAKVAPHRNVGLVRSYDDTLENALMNLGVPTRRLSADDLAFRDLSPFDAILVDIRAYRVRDDLVAFNQRLLDYVAEGGTLVVFYQKTAEWNPPAGSERSFAPLPLEVTRSRVVDEDADVTILLPDHPLLSEPNQISANDFAGWVHERGLYFPDASYDPAYQELLASNDVGEEPKKGGLLVVRHGRGTYVYTSYGWYRQWIAGVPGAYRFLANLVSIDSASIQPPPPATPDTPAEDSQR